MPRGYNNSHYSDSLKLINGEIKVVAVKHRTLSIGKATVNKDKENKVTQNLSTIAAIMLDDNLVSVTGSFANYQNKTRKTYTYKCLRSMAETLKKNDLIVVEKKTSEGEGALFTVVFVVDVHDTLNIDPDDGINYAYVVSKIDTGLLDVLQKAEDDMVAHIKRKRREAWKQQLVTSLVTPELEQEKLRAKATLEAFIVQPPTEVGPSPAYRGVSVFVEHVDDDHIPF
jgi:hypothetical protein